MPHPGSGPTSSGARLTRNVRIVCFPALFDRGECGEETGAMMSKNDAACGSGMSPGPQASVVEDGIALDSHNSRGTHPPSPERFASGSLSTRAASKSDRSSGSPTLATGSVRRQSLCNPLLLWRHFNISQSSLGSCSARFSCFHKAFSSGSSVMQSTSCPGCVFTCMSSVAGVLLGREFTVFRCSLLWRERRWVVAASGG